jgi:AcrR family transcriptional regulator
MAPVSDSKRALVERFRRYSILEAARHVIARKGRGGASMQAIADEAGVAKGTLYLYFRDRDDLLQHTGELVFEELLVRLTAVLGEPRPLPESLRDLVRTKLEFFDENQDFLRVYMALRHGADMAASRRRRRQAPRYARYVESLTHYLAAAAARGEMKPFDPERIALVFVEGVTAILLHRLEGNGRPRAEEVDWIVDLLLNGLYPRRDT